MTHKSLVLFIKGLKHVSVSIIVFLTLSCDKMLDLQPSDYIDENDLFTSINRLNQGVLGIYAGWYPEHTLRISSLITDECRIGLQNTGVDGTGQNIFRWIFTSDEEEILAPWRNAYQVIGRVNYILKDIDRVPITTETDFKTINSIKGELLGIRAYEHFELYRIYSYSGVYDAKALAVPYMTEYNTTINSQPSRPDTNSFFTALWKDLLEAEKLVPENHNIRMGITAIEALHARAALYTQNYSEASIYSGKVIDKMPLAPYIEFPAIWTDQSDIEVIFKLKRNNASTTKPGDLFYNIGADRILFTPSLKLMKSYDSIKDIRYKSWFSTDESLIEEGNLPDIIIKYKGDENRQNINDVKIFRTAEMYLIRSECELQKGNLTGATQDLNTLRASRIKDYTPETFTTIDDLSIAIFTERFKELPYEGHRYFDLKRLNKSIERDINDAEEGSIVLYPDVPQYFIPIPQSEVMANPNIRPNNKGW